ncbi:hypothetical protein [Streptomyces sp. ISL-94]|uniref:hypothetical protein n=1 Tax=Streptomyces sp. ISL-94 TaxID=2819190 RepID=UPI001BECFD31|nr:hypothetical protein [Streptomyces sp. ISL-94]MBT2478188.1 hypothetical protein [Streptomyces sp. ISL-94]
MSSHQPLVIAAAQAAGPCVAGEESAWQTRVRALAVDLFVLGDVVARDIQRLGAATRFPATLLGVVTEDSSKRGVLLLRNVSGELEPAIRTDRGDTDAGAAMITRAQSLVGRRVLVYKEMEALASNPMHKARVVVHLMDLGLETESIGEDEAKGHVLQAAAGDRDLALRAWQQASLPDRGPVTAAQLGGVLACLQQASRT